MQKPKHIAAFYQGNLSKIKSLTAFLIIVIFCGSWAVQAAEITIANSGFESPACESPDVWGGAPTNWAIPGSGLVKVMKPVVNQPNAYEGDQVLGLDQTAWAYQDLSATWDASKDYILTVYAATPSFSPNTSGIHIELRNASTDATLAQKDVQLNGRGQGWSEVQVSILGSSLGANAGSGIRIFIQKPSWSGGGYTIVDKVTLKELTRIPIANQSFEFPVCGTDDTWGGTPTNWMIPGSGYKNVIRPVVNQPNAYEGLQVLGLDAYSWVYQDLAATWDASKDYTLTVYGATPSFSTNKSGIHIDVRNAATNAILASNDVWLNNSGGPWMAVPVSISGSALASNAGSGIRIFVQKPGWSGEGYTIVDNVVMVPTPAAPTTSQDGTWNSDSSGVWSDSSKWQGGNIAYGVNQTANFIADITVPRTVSLDIAATIGAMVFRDTAASSSKIGWNLEMDDPLAAHCKLNMSGTVTPSITVGTTATENALIAVSIAGSQGLEKKGPGLLTLTGNNTYTGTTTISNGVLRIGHQAALGSGGVGNDTVVASGAALQLLDPAGSNFAAEPITLNGTGIDNTGALRAITGSGDSAMAWNGPVSLGSHSTIGVDAGAQLYLQAAITGSYNLTKAGNGYLFLVVESPNFTGNLTIAQGVVRINDVDRLRNCSSITIPDGGELQLDCNGERVTSYPTYITGAGSDGLGALKVVGSKQVAWTYLVLTGPTTVLSRDGGGLYLGTLLGSGDLIKLGNSLLDLELLSPGYDGNVICKEGRLQWRHFATAPGTTVGNTTLWDGTGLTLVTDNVNGDPSYAPGGSPTQVNITYPESLVIGGGSGTSGVYLQKITYINDHTGNPRGNVKDTIAGTITLNTSLRVDVAPAGWERAYEDCLTLSGTISGIGDITKTGIGVLEITGNNSYAGNMTVNGGTLRLTGSNNKLPDTSILSVASGAKVELGSGVNETVSNLILNGVVQPAGTYNASNTPAYFMGSGNLIVASSATVTGTVALADWQGALQNMPVTVKLKNTGTTSYSSVLDADGKFTVGTPGAGTYSVLVQVNGWLAKKQTGIVISNGSNTLGTPFSLINGDCSYSNKLDLSDFAVLASDWSVTEIDLAADLNGNGTVDIDDLLILVKSWLMVGDTL